MSHNKEFCIHFDNGFWKINPKIQYFTKYLLSLFGFPNIMYKPLVICFVILASFKVSVSGFLYRDVFVNGGCGFQGRRLLI